MALPRRRHVRRTEARAAVLLCVTPAWQGQVQPQAALAAPAAALVQQAARLSCRRFKRSLRLFFEPRLRLCCGRRGGWLRSWWLCRIQRMFSMWLWGSGGVSPAETVQYSPPSP